MATKNRPAPAGQVLPLNAPTKGAKFYSTGWRNANKAGYFQQISARRILDFIPLFFNSLIEAISSRTMPEGHC